jgi:hypothetical protein
MRSIVEGSHGKVIVTAIPSPIVPLALLVVPAPAHLRVCPSDWDAR